MFPFRTHLTANRLKRGYVEVTVEETCSLFEGGQQARGFVCHIAEILQERVVGGLPAVGSARRNSISGRDEGWQAGYSALMQAPGAKAVQEVSSLPRLLTPNCPRRWLLCCTELVPDSCEVRSHHDPAYLRKSLCAMDRLLQGLRLAA